MSETLFIQLGDNELAPIHWGVLEKGQTEFNQSGHIANMAALGTLKPQLSGRLLVVIVPGTRVNFTRVEVPGGKNRHTSKLLPFMLEEHLAVSDVDDLHFACGAKVINDKLPTAIVEKEVLTAWLARFAELGYEPVAVIPDIQLIPKVSEDNQSVLLATGDKVIFDNQDALTVVTEPGIFKDYIALAAARAAKGKKDETEATIPTVKVYADSEASLDQVIEALGDSYQVASRALVNPLQVMASHYSAQSINLLQGEFSRQVKLLKHLKYWKLAASLAVGALVIQLASVGVQINQLENYRDALKDEVVEVYKEAFPDAKKVRSPKKKMRAELKKLGTGTKDEGYMEMLSQVTTGFSKVLDVKPSGLSYESRKGEMRIDVIGVDYAALERFKQTLTDLGLMAELSSASANKGKYQGRIQIRSGS